jgi:ketosteroid isomerase-like protein
VEPREVVTRYYELANAGDWDAWCDLFTADQVMDEQLAGRVEGREPLREMMKGFPAAYERFSNTPEHVVVGGNEVAVTSHISAVTAKGASIEADVCNYFQISDGQIVYMKNFHDTKPFAPLFTSDD